MKLIISFIAILGMSGFALAQPKVNPTDPQPTCYMCPGTYIPVAELDAYTKKRLQKSILINKYATLISVKLMSELAWSTGAN